MAYFILHNFFNALSSSEYPASLKYADITLIFKKDDKTDKANDRPISILAKSMNDSSKIRCIYISTRYSQSISGDSGKDIMLNIA